MGEITFIRHGQASFGAENYDLLSPLGVQQAAWLGQYLRQSGARFDRVVSGTLTRHRQTRDEILTALPHPAPDEDARLNEMSFFAMARAHAAATDGDIPQSDPKQMEAHFLQVLGAWERGEIPDAPETLASFRARVLAAISAYGRAGQHVLIISSGGPLGIIMGAILGLDLRGTAEIILNAYNSSISRFRLRHGALRLVQYNSVAHLEQPTRRHALTFL